MRKLKAILCMILSLAMLAGSIPVSELTVLADPVVTSGNWTDYAEEIEFVWEGNSKIYNITKPEQFAWVAAGINDGSLSQAEAKFRLMADIDLSAHYWIPIGTSDSKVFIKPFDGNGHTISGMRIGSAENPYNGSEYVGLFGYAQINVSDLRITDAVIYANPPSFGLYTGLLVGYAKGTGTISGCECSGRIYTNGSLAPENGPIGGIAGYITGTVTVDSCRTQVTVGALDSSKKYYYGGIAGIAGPSVAASIHVKIQNSVSSVSVELPEGMNPEKISGGAIAGYSKADASCSVINCFGIADHGGASRSMDLTVYSSGSYIPVPTGAKSNVIIVDHNHKIKEGNSYVAQDNAYTFYGYSDGTGADPQEMTEAELKDADFVELLNQIAGSIEGFDPLTWEIDANVNGGFPNLPDAKAGEGDFLTVTFISEGETYQTKAVERGQTVSAPEEPEAADGKIFLYWYVNDEYTEYDFSTPVTKNLTLTAKWEMPAPVGGHTVRFDSMGGSYVYPQTVEDGEKLTAPAIPQKSGYTFGGWYKDSACKTAWNFNTAVTCNMTLYAKWNSAPNVSVSGRITDVTTGDGIRNATVSLLNGPNDVTDEFGYYRIVGVSKGTYTINVKAHDYEEYSQTNFKVGTVSTGFDAALTPLPGGGGGAEATVNVYATVSCVFSGIMLDGVEIKAVGEGNLGTYPAVTANGGLATFTGIPAGKYTFHINESGRPGWENYVSEQKELTGDYQLNCALKPNYQTLKVNVLGSYDPKTDSANAPLKGKTVTLIGVDPKDEENELINITAYTGNDGSVTVEKLVPITWKVSCTDFAYEEDEVVITSDSKGRFSEDEVTLTLPFINSSMTVNLTSVYSDPDIFKRTDENKDTLPDVTLAGVTGTMTEGIIRTGKPDATGRVDFTGLFPGTYNLSANGRVTRVVDITSSADGLEIFSDANDGNFSRFGRKHFDVDFHGAGTGAVALGMHTNATLDMDPAPVSFSGILYKTDMDENGEISSEPLKNAKLFIKPSAYYPQSGVNENGYEVTTDNNGYYSITMAPGLYGVEMENTYDGYFGGKLLWHEGNSDGYQGPWGWPCTGKWTGTKASAVAWMTGDDNLAYGDIGGMSLSSGTAVADLEIMEKKINYSACSPGNSVVYDNTSSQNLIIGSEQDEEATVSQNTNKWHKYDYYNRSYQTTNYHPETNGATLTLKRAGSTDQSINMTGKTFPVVFNELDPGDYSLDYTLSASFSHLSPTVSWGGNISFFQFPAPGKLPASFPEDYAVNENPWPLSTKYSGLRIDPKQGQWKIGDLYDGNDSNGEVKFKIYWADTYYDISYVGGMVQEAEYQSWFDTYGADFDPIWRRSDDPTVEREDSDGYYRNRPNSADYQDYGVFEQDLRAWEEEVQELRTSRPGKWVAKLDGTYTEGAFTATYTGNPHWNDLYENTQTIMENYLVAYSTDKLPGKLFRASGKGSGINKVLPDGNVTLYFCAPKGRGYAFIKNLDHIFNQENYSELANSDLWFSVTLNKDGETDCLVNFLDPTDCSEPVKILSQTEAMNLLNPRTIVVKAVEEDNVENVLDNVTVTITYADRQYSSTTNTPMQTCTGNVTDVVIGEDAAYEWECTNPTNTRSTYDDGSKTETFYVPLRRIWYSKEFLIKDDAGNPIVNASITLTGKDHGQPITIFTGQDGKANVYERLNYQDYDVHVASPGYGSSNITLTAEDVRSNDVKTDSLLRDAQPEFDEDHVSINRKGAFLPGVNFAGSSNSIDFLVDVAITDAKDKPLYFTVDAKVKTAPADSLLEVFLIDKRAFRNADFGDVPEALATPAMDEYNYNPSEAWLWGEKLEKGELGNVYYRRFSGDEPFVSEKDSHDWNVYEIEKVLPLWELPPDGFEPCLLAVTANHAMQIYDFDYSGEDEGDQLVGIRLNGDSAAMLNNITLLANAQALGGPAIEKLEELTEPTGSIIPLPSFEAGIEEEDGFLSYDYTVEMELLQGKKSVSDAEKSYMAILPSTLGIVAKGGWKMGVDGEERKVTNSFNVTVAGKDMDALDYLPAAFKALPVKVEFDEDNPPSGTITLAAADTKDKNNHNTQEEYSLGINGQVHLNAEVSAFSSFGAMLPVGPVLASLEKSGALDIGAKVQVAVGADGTYTYRIINGEEDETQHEIEFTLGAGAGIGFYAKALGGALGAEANLKLSGDNDKLEDMVTVSATISKEDGFKMNRIDGKVLADAHIEMKTWFINGEKDFKFAEIPFSYQFGTETNFTLTKITIEDNMRSRNDFTTSTFNGHPEAVISNLLPIGGYATDEDGNGSFVYTDMSAKGGNVRLMLSQHAGNKVWNAPVPVTQTSGLIPAFDVISKPDGSLLVVWSEIAQADMMMTCPPSTIRYSVGKVEDGAWSGSASTLATLPSEVAANLLLVSDASTIYLTTRKTAEGAVAEKWSLGGYKYSGNKWSKETILAKDLPLYEISACAADGSLFVSYATDDQKLHVLKWSTLITDKIFDTNGSESAMASDDSNAYLIYETQNGLTFTCYTNGAWADGKAIDSAATIGNPAVAIYGGNLAVSWTDETDRNLYLSVCGPDGSIQTEKTKLKTITDRFRDSTAAVSGNEIIVLSVVDGKEADYLNAYGATGNQKAPAMVTMAPAPIDGLVFNHEEQRLVIAGAAEGGTIEYAAVPYGTSAPTSDKFKAVLPTVKDAGVYRVYYRVKADDDHTEPPVDENQYVEAEIGKVPLRADMFRFTKSVFEVTGDIPDGTQYEPEFILKDGEQTLTKDQDYRINDGSDLSANAFGTYTVSVSGLGNYAGSMLADWKVMQVEEDNNEETLFSHSVIEPLIYDGTKKTPEPTIIWNGLELENGTDYTLSYKNNINAASKDAAKNPPSLTVKGKGRYNKTMTFPFTIERRSIGDGNAYAADFDVSISDMPYTGKKAYSKPVIRFTDGSGKVVVLKENRDYKLSYLHENNSTEPVEAGEVAVTVEGIGNFTGSAKSTYQIIAKSVAQELKNAVVAAIPNQPYTGVAYTQEEIENLIVVKASKAKDAPVVDQNCYTVSYDPLETLRAGKVTVNIHGTDGHAELWKSVSFKIVPKPVKDGDTQQVEIRFTDGLDPVYTGKALKPAVTAWDLATGNEIAAANYTVKYANNTVAAEEDAIKTVRGKNVSISPTVTLTFKGSYSGSLSKTFRIAPRLLDETDLEITQGDIRDNGKPIDQSAIKPSVKYGKTALKKDKDFKVLFERQENSQIQTAGIELIGNYRGEKDFNFRICDKTAAVSLSDDGVFNVVTNDTGLIYTGKKLMPEVKVTATENGETWELIPGRDYVLSCSNNVNASEATAKKAPTWKVTGKGLYKGSRTGKFTIRPKELSDETCIITVADAKYNKSQTLTPKVTVIDKSTGKAIKAGTCYTVVPDPDHNKEVTRPDTLQKPTVTITGKGNYTTAGYGLDGDVITKNFRIYLKDISAVRAVWNANAPTLYYTGERHLPTNFTVYPDKKSKEPLTEWSDAEQTGDYIMNYGENINVGNGTVILEGKGDYGNTKVISFKIWPRILQWLLH